MKKRIQIGKINIVFYVQVYEIRQKKKQIKMEKQPTLPFLEKPYAQLSRKEKTWGIM